MTKPARKKTSGAKKAKTNVRASERKAIATHSRSKKSPPSPEKESWSHARDEQHRLKRDAILRVASRLINRKGDAGTSLADIANELDLRNASLYYYFKSKSDLIFACFQRAQRIDMESLDAAEENATSGLDAIERYIIVMSERIRDEGELPLLVGIRALRHEQMKVIAASRLEKLERMADLIERGIRDKSIRGCDVPLATTLLQGALQAAPGHFISVASAERPRLLEELISSIRRLLGA